MSGELVKLVDGVNALELTISAGYFVERIDLGFPEIRDNVSPRVQSSGTRDRTAYHGARAVGLEVTLVPTDAKTLTELLDDLRSYCRPGARPYLELTRDGETRRVRLRADQQSAPIDSIARQRTKVQWRAPDGIIEAADLEVATASATADAEAGRTYPRTYPIVYPASSAIGSVLVTNRGTTNADPVLRIYGPCTGPRVENQTLGLELVFDADLVVAAGTFLEVDVQARTVLLNGDPAQSRYDRLDFPASDWWALAAGVNRLRFAPVEFSAGSKVEVRFRSAWL